MFEIIFDILGALLSPFVSLLSLFFIPIIVVAIGLFVIVLFSKTTPRESERYKKSQSPVGYRKSVGWSPSCYYCPHAKPTQEDHGISIMVDSITGAEQRISNKVYCSKYDTDVYSYYTCDTRYTTG